MSYNYVAISSNNRELERKKLERLYLEEEIKEGIIEKDYS